MTLLIFSLLFWLSSGIANSYVERRIVRAATYIFGSIAFGLAIALTAAN